MAEADGGPKSRARTGELENLVVGSGGGVGGCVPRSKGFYELADILIVEVSYLGRQLKFNPEVGDDHPVIAHLTASLWFRSMEPTITSSTSKTRGANNERKNVAAAEKQVELMVYRLKQERGRWPFLTPRLENVTDKTREFSTTSEAGMEVSGGTTGSARREREIEMTVGRFVTAANEVTIGGFWREHVKGELKTRRDYEILRFLSSYWEKKYLKEVFFEGNAIFEKFVQDLLSMPINLLLALYLVYPRYLFKMGPSYMFSRGLETLRIDGYLTLILLTHG